MDDEHVPAVEALRCPLVPAAQLVVVLRRQLQSPAAATALPRGPAGRVLTHLSARWRQVWSLRVCDRPGLHPRRRQRRAPRKSVKPSHTHRVGSSHEKRPRAPAGGHFTARRPSPAEQRAARSGPGATFPEKPPPHGETQRRARSPTEIEYYWSQRCPRV